MLSSVVTFHISAGAIALLAGYLVICLPKGETYHKYLGRTYLVAMLSLGISGAYIAAIRDVPLSMLNGLVLCYFVLSSLSTIWQPPKHVNIWDKLLLAFVILITCGFVWYSYQTTLVVDGQLGGFSTTAYVVFGSVMLFCTAADFRYIFRGGLTGSSRLKRHLWRMFFPLLMSTAAFFLGQAKHLPELFQQIELLLMPVALVMMTGGYWFVKVNKRILG